MRLSQLVIPELVLELFAVCFQERIKLYLGYKAHHAVLDTFPENTICTSKKAVRDCKSYEMVKGWGNALRKKYVLLTRWVAGSCAFASGTGLPKHLRLRLQGAYNPELTSRSGSLGGCHILHVRSSSHDMMQKRHGPYHFCSPFLRSAHKSRQDFGHKTFWQSLKDQVGEIEDLLEDVERRAYELLLTSQNALWVLDQKHEQGVEQCTFEDESLQKTPTACVNVVPDQNLKPPNHKPPAERCVIFDDRPLSNPQEEPISSAPIVLEDIEDPIDVAIREKRVELWELIWTRLARYCAPARSRYYKERLTVIWACVCRAVWTDPSLMLVAQNYRSPKSLLKDSKLDLPTVERLWNAIKDLYVDDVRAAIDDVLHPVRQKGEYVVLLGTRVHKELADTSLPLHGWGHMTAVAPCYSCVRQVCKTVSSFPISILPSTHP